MNTDVMFSSKSGNWETPQRLFDDLNREFHFTLDACATAQNAKCTRYYNLEQNGLRQPWSGVVWCNPPYGRKIGQWVRKAFAASSEGSTVVMLLPARTDTKWFHDWIYNRSEIRFLKGRLKFGGGRRMRHRSRLWL